MRDVKIDYVELVDAETMRPVERVEGPVLLAVAAVLENARLIDNVKFDPAGNGGFHT
jgi:pantoate--beta-alanine ligase